MGHKSIESGVQVDVGINRRIGGKKTRRMRRRRKDSEGRPVERPINVDGIAIVPGEP